MAEHVPGFERGRAVLRRGANGCVGSAQQWPCCLSCCATPKVGSGGRMGRAHVALPSLQRPCCQDGNLVNERGGGTWYTGQPANRTCVCTCISCPAGRELPGSSCHPRGAAHPPLPPPRSQMQRQLQLSLEAHSRYITSLLELPWYPQRCGINYCFASLSAV